MSQQIFQITADVDDEALANWVGQTGREVQGGPYSENFADWDASDLFRAADFELVDPGSSDLTYLGPAETT